MCGTTKKCKKSSLNYRLAARASKEIYIITKSTSNKSQAKQLKISQLKQSSLSIALKGIASFAVASNLKMSPINRLHIWPKSGVSNTRSSRVSNDAREHQKK
jgi:hypothetical protein